VRDTLTRRDLGPDGPSGEKTISTPFSVFFQFAASSNERFLIVAGRLDSSNVTREERDGIFLLDLDSGHFDRVAPYASLGQDTRCLNVDDSGKMIVFEDNKTVVLFRKKDGKFILSAHHPGQFPALFPADGHYLYWDRGLLLLSEVEAPRELISLKNVVGAIRVSPDSEFVAFGIDVYGDLSSSKLRICDLKTLECVDGPLYDDFIAGRETFWIYN
jgi:hypothetical protein